MDTKGQGIKRPWKVLLVIATVAMFMLILVSGERRCRHIWAEATWTVPQTCTECRMITGVSVRRKVIDEIRGTENAVFESCQTFAEVCDRCFDDAHTLETILLETEEAYLLKFQEIADIRAFMMRAGIACYEFGKNYQPGEVKNLVIQGGEDFLLVCVAVEKPAEPDGNTNLYYPTRFTTLDLLTDKPDAIDEIRSAYEYVFCEEMTDYNHFIAAMQGTEFFPQFRHLFGSGAGD